MEVQDIPNKDILPNEGDRKAALERLTTFKSELERRELPPKKSLDRALFNRNLLQEVAGFPELTPLISDEGMPVSQNGGLFIVPTYQIELSKMGPRLSRIVEVSALGSSTAVAETVDLDEPGIRNYWVGKSDGELDEPADMRPERFRNDAVADLAKTDPKNIINQLFRTVKDLRIV